MNGKTTAAFIGAGIMLLLVCAGVFYNAWNDRRTQSALDQIRDSYSRLENQSLRLAESVGSVSKAVADLGGQFQSITERVGQLAGDVKGLRGSIGAAQSTLNGLSGSVGNLEDTNAEFARLIEELTSEFEGPK